MPSVPVSGPDRRLLLSPFSVPPGTRLKIASYQEIRNSGSGRRPCPLTPGRRPCPLTPGRRLPAARLAGSLLVPVLWAAASAAGGLDPGAVPAPWTVLRTARHLWTEGTVPTDALTSPRRAAYGFALGLTGGVLPALAAGLTRTGEALIDGTANLYRAVPTLGLIPLFILGPGIGETFKVTVIAIAAHIPVWRRPGRRRRVTRCSRTVGHTSG